MTTPTSAKTDNQPGDVFLAKLASLKGWMIVSSNELTTLDIAQAQACRRFYVIDDGSGAGLGFALMPIPQASANNKVNF